MLDELRDAAAIVELVDFSGSSRSSLIVMRMPLLRKAFSRSRSESLSKLNSVVSKICRVRLESDLGAALLGFCQFALAGQLEFRAHIPVRRSFRRARSPDARLQTESSHTKRRLRAGRLRLCMRLNRTYRRRESLVMTTSAADRFSFVISTGIPRPLSLTVMELSRWIVTSTVSQYPANASSIELSTTS